MTQKTLKQKFKEKILEEVEPHKETITRGSADSYAQYKYLCGYLGGIELALRIFEEIWDEHTKKYYNE